MGSLSYTQSARRQLFVNPTDDLAQANFLLLARCHVSHGDGMAGQLIFAKDEGETHIDAVGVLELRPQAAIAKAEQRGHAARRNSAVAATAAVLAARRGAGG